MKPHQIFLVSVIVGTAALVALLVLAGTGRIDLDPAQTQAVPEAST